MTATVFSLDSLYDLVHCISFLFYNLLMEWLLLKVKRKTAYSFTLFQYRKLSIIIIILGYILYILAFVYNKREFYLQELWLMPVLSFIFIAFKQIYGYSKAEINTCLRDCESIGAYWAHQAYDVYYKLVFEDIKERMIAFEKEHKIDISCKKLLVIIPLSCDTESTLLQKDDKIEKFGFLEPIENDQGANINRRYKNAVHKISLDEDIYVVAEFSSPVATLWKSKSDMEKKKLFYIRDCYIKTLKSLVFSSPCIIVEYDDVNCPESLGSCIVTSIKKEKNYFI